MRQGSEVKTVSDANPPARLPCSLRALSRPWNTSDDVVVGWCPAILEQHTSLLRSCLPRAFVKKDRDAERQRQAEGGVFNDPLMDSCYGQVTKKHLQSHPQ